jgi:flagellar biosynthesis component FlhA
MKILDEDELFNEFSRTKNEMSDCNTNWNTSVERWSEVFEFLQSEGISLRNIHTILEFSLAIPGTSASIERVFSITNALWTD